jgi:hypothetical protein
MGNEQNHKFTFNDTVRIKRDAPNPLRQGQTAAVTMVFLPQDRVGSYFDLFPSGVLYSVEYEYGQSVDVHEDFLEAS